MTAAAAVKAPSRAARRDPIEIRRFHNNSYANQTWTSNSGDEFPHRGGNDRPALTRRRSRRNLGRHAAVVDAAMVGAGAERLDETRIASVVLRDRAESDRSGAQMRLTSVIAISRRGPR